jgi:hypothetical protein
MAQTLTTEITTLNRDRNGPVIADRARLYIAPGQYEDLPGVGVHEGEHWGGKWVAFGVVEQDVRIPSVAPGRVLVSCGFTDDLLAALNESAAFDDDDECEYLSVGLESIGGLGIRRLLVPRVRAICPDGRIEGADLMAWCEPREIQIVDIDSPYASSRDLREMTVDELVGELGCLFGKLTAAASA